MRRQNSSPHLRFGETPFELDRIFRALDECTVFMAIGTSGMVKPAASFVAHVQDQATTIYAGPEEPANRFAFSDSSGNGGRSAATIVRTNLAQPRTITSSESALSSLARYCVFPWARVTDFSTHTLRQSISRPCLSHTSRTSQHEVQTRCSFWRSIHRQEMDPNQEPCRTHYFYRCRTLRQCCAAEKLDTETNNSTKILRGICLHSCNAMTTMLALYTSEVKIF